MADANGGTINHPINLEKRMIDPQKVRMVCRRVTGTYQHRRQLRMKGERVVVQLFPLLTINIQTARWEKKGVLRPCVALCPYAHKKQKTFRQTREKDNLSLVGSSPIEPLCLLRRQVDNRSAQGTWLVYEGEFSTWQLRSETLKGLDR
jgi:hypothetical protein